MAEVAEKEDAPVTGQPRPVRNVISYLRTLDGSAHPALDSVNNGVIFDSTKSVYVVEPPIESLNNEAEREAKLFGEALKSYEAEVPKKYKTGVNIDQPHSIADGVKQIDSSLKEYKHADKKTAWEVIRKGFWKLSEQNGLENWLELLPSSNDYCSLIYGGLNLIIKAAGRIGDVRNEAFRALAEIPYHLESTRESVGIFNKSEALRKCGVRLYTVTLEALGHILKWFKMRAVGKAFGAFLKQGSYQSELLAKIAEIETVSTRFKDISMSCLQRGVVNTERTVASLATASASNHLIIKEAIDQSSLQLGVEIERTNRALESLRLEETKQYETTQQVLSDELKALKMQQKRQQEDQLERDKRTAEALNNFKCMLESIYAALPLFGLSKDPPPIYKENPEPQKNLVSSSQILGVLGHEKDISQTDLLHSLRGLNSMNRTDQDRAVWAMKSPSLRSWLLSTSSSPLLINSCCPTTRARSPLTFLCARLIDSLKVDENFLVVHFFCGQHLSSAIDPNATPLGMMNSLLAQLLVQYPDFEISNHDLADISRNTLDGVERLFGKLVAQLPPTMMLFCIVDGISLYEDAVRLTDTRKAMHGLAELVKRSDGACLQAHVNQPNADQASAGERGQG